MIRIDELNQQIEQLEFMASQATPGTPACELALGRLRELKIDHAYAQRGAV